VVIGVQVASNNSEAFLKVSRKNQPAQTPAAISVTARIFSKGVMCIRSLGMVARNPPSRLAQQLRQLGDVGGDAPGPALLARRSDLR